ncbi:MAG: hypothetical protein ACYDBJ_15290 [Aggregatilineales bacterium]
MGIVFVSFIVGTLLSRKSRNSTKPSTLDVPETSKPLLPAFQSEMVANSVGLLARLSDLLRAVLLISSVGLMYYAQLQLFRNPRFAQDDLYALLVVGWVGASVVLWIAPLPVPEIKLPGAVAIRIRWPLLILSIELALFAGWRSLVAANATVYEQLIVWVLSMIGLKLAFVPTQPLISRADRLKKWEWVLIGLLFIGALLIRGVNIETMPRGMEDNEAEFALAGAAITPNGMVSSPFRSGFDAYAFLQSDLAGISIQFLGINASAARIPSVLLGTLTIPAIYLLGRELYNWRLGLAASMFALGWAFHIQFSRLGLNQVGDPCFGTLRFTFSFAE